MSKQAVLIGAGASFLFLLFAGCKKADSFTSLLEKRSCWQVVDNYGNALQEICNKTEAQIKALYPNSCSYYRNEGEKGCWLVGNTFLGNLPEAGVDMYVRCYNLSGARQNVRCDYCQTFYHRVKMTYKPANTVTYSTVSLERFCGDTSATLFHGRQVVLRDTPDSLIVRQFSKDAISW